jgi:hypothetical protein
MAKNNSRRAGSESRPRISLAVKELMRSVSMGCIVGPARSAAVAAYRPFRAGTSRPGKATARSRTCWRAALSRRVKVDSGR